MAKLVKYTSPRPLGDFSDKSYVVRFNSKLCFLPKSQMQYVELYDDHAVFEAPDWFGDIYKWITPIND